MPLSEAEHGLFNRNLHQRKGAEAIVLGGAITAEGDALLTPIKEAANLPCPVLISALGADAGIIGAAVFATID